MGKGRQHLGVVDKSASEGEPLKPNHTRGGRPSPLELMRVKGTKPGVVQDGHGSGRTK